MIKVMDTTTGDIVEQFESQVEAEEWMSRQDVPEKYDFWREDD
jgi:hypothetical protein